MRKGLIHLLFLFFLTGCWDRTLLNQTKLITAGAFDYTKDGKLKTTVAVPQAISAEASRGSIINQTYTATGHTVRQSRLRLDRKISENLDASKNQIIVIGEEAAKKDIYPLLDIFYRDPKAALNAKIAVSKGDANQLISTEYEETEMAVSVGEYLRDLIKSSEKGATIPVENIQTICPVMFDPGQDFAIPYLDHSKKTVRVRGVALFHGHKMVGKIIEPLSVTYTLMTGIKRTRDISNTQKIYHDKKETILNYVTIKVKRNKRTFKVDVSPAGEISALLKLKLAAVITEYPTDKLNTPSELKKVEKKLSEKYTKDAQKIIERLQEMNSDPFGVGRQVMAFHYPVWEKLNWNEEYPKINFKAKVNVEVIGHGIIE